MYSLKLILGINLEHRPEGSSSKWVNLSKVRRMTTRMVVKSQRSLMSQTKQALKSVGKLTINRRDTNLITIPRGIQLSITMSRCILFTLINIITSLNHKLCHKTNKKWWLLKHKWCSKIHGWRKWWCNSKWAGCLLVIHLKWCNNLVLKDKGWWIQWVCLLWVWILTIILCSKALILWDQMDN